MPMPSRIEIYNPKHMTSAHVIRDVDTGEWWTMPDGAEAWKHLRPYNASPAQVRRMLQIYLTADGREIQLREGEAPPAGAVCRDRAYLLEMQGVTQWLGIPDDVVATGRDYYKRGRG